MRRPLSHRPTILTVIVQCIGQFSVRLRFNYCMLVKIFQFLILTLQNKIEYLHFCILKLSLHNCENALLGMYQYDIIVLCNVGSHFFQADVMYILSIKFSFSTHS